MYMDKLNYICFMRTNKGMLKGSLQIIILKLLKERGRMYGYEITQLVKELTRGEIVLTEGALYPALHKMEKDGLLLTEVELVENRARKYYALSKKGMAEVKVKLEETKSFLDNLSLLLKLNPKLA